MIVSVYKKPARIYVCHVDHEHDRIYSENVVEYLGSKNVSSKVIQLASGGTRTELQQCLADREAAVLSFNTTLDHSWLGSESFLAAAERRAVISLRR